MLFLILKFKVDFNNKIFCKWQSHIGFIVRLWRRLNWNLKVRHTHELIRSRTLTKRCTLRLQSLFRDQLGRYKKGTNESTSLLQHLQLSYVLFHETKWYKRYVDTNGRTGYVRKSTRNWSPIRYSQLYIWSELRNLRNTLKDTFWFLIS